MRRLPILMALSVTLLACERGAERASEPAAAGAETPLARCGVDGVPVLTGEGIGALRIGVSVEQVTLACLVASDTLQPGPEGTTERVLAVVLGDRPDTLRAVVTGDSIWRMHVTSVTPRTADSLGVGSALAQLRPRPGAQLISGEGRIFVTMRDPCGLSFRLDQPDTIRGATLASLPDSLLVAEVLVTGCR